MGEALTKQTAAEYLAWEPMQKERHIYVRGEIFAMPGGTFEHSYIAGNLFIALKSHLKGTPCKVGINDMRVAVEKADCYFYPDVFVTCAKRDTENPKLTEVYEAKLIAEVLSANTASYDRGTKFADYRQLGSLEEYVLIDPDARTVEVFRKNASNIWELHPSDAASPAVSLQSVGWQGHLADFFGG
jgi:Uma2 family endonuclease